MLESVGSFEVVAFVRYCRIRINFGAFLVTPLQLFHQVRMFIGEVLHHLLLNVSFPDRIAFRCFSFGTLHPPFHILPCIQILISTQVPAV